MRLLLISVLLSFLLTNCPTEDTQLVEMTASVSPEGAGEVNPPNGTYVAGREITIETDPVDDRWEFTGWTGDTTASDDSLTFVVTRNMDLVANYEIPSESQPVLATMAQPKEGGTINPDGGNYELDASVDVEAVPNEGWEFIEWSGDTSSTSNPLTLTMGKSYDLTAKFEELVNQFTNQITVTDGTNNMDLSFGMDTNATAGFDIGIDRDLPPPPPEGSFYAQFNIPDYALAEDFRSVGSEETVWTLEFAPDQGQTISLNWDFSGTNHVGSLTLTDDSEDPSFEIDMKSETTYEVSDESLDILYIISN